MKYVHLVFDNWNLICAFALLVAALVLCARKGVNVNHVDDFPKRR